MKADQIDADLYADEEFDPVPEGRQSTLLKTLQYLLIATLFVVPILALLKPHFSHPEALPALTPANGVQVQTTNFDAVRNTTCTGDHCPGSL